MRLSDLTSSPPRGKPVCRYQGVSVTAGGSVSYGCTLDAVHRQTRGVDLSLDLISR
jgi:hypothetical protein